MDNSEWKNSKEVDDVDCKRKDVSYYQVSTSGSGVLNVAAQVLVVPGNAARYSN